MVRIHAGEPTFGFNSLNEDCRAFVQILYRRFELRDRTHCFSCMSTLGMDSRLESIFGLCGLRAYFQATEALTACSISSRVDIPCVNEMKFNRRTGRPD